MEASCREGLRGSQLVWRVGGSCVMCCVAARQPVWTGTGSVRERKKSPPTRGGVACLFIMHHGKLLGPGLANL